MRTAHVFFINPDPDSAIVVKTGLNQLESARKEYRKKKKKKKQNTGTYKTKKTKQNTKNKRKTNEKQTKTKHKKQAKNKQMQHLALVNNENVCQSQTYNYCCCTRLAALLHKLLLLLMMPNACETVSRRGRSSAVIFASSASKQGGSAKAVDYEGANRQPSTFTRIDIFFLSLFGLLVYVPTIPVERHVAYGVSGVNE